MALRIIDYAARAAIALILLQTLWFKFRAEPESVAIFTSLHAEPWGRILAGIAELAACVLLLFHGTVFYGAALSLSTMLGAILAHVFVIGISVQADSGLLFGLAVAVACLSLLCICIHRRQAARALNSLRAWATRH